MSVVTMHSRPANQESLSRPSAQNERCGYRGQPELRTGVARPSRAKPTRRPATTAKAHPASQSPELPALGSTEVSVKCEHIGSLSLNWPRRQPSPKSVGDKSDIRLVRGESPVGILKKASKMKCRSEGPCGEWGKHVTIEALPIRHTAPRTQSEPAAIPVIQNDPLIDAPSLASSTSPRGRGLLPPMAGPGRPSPPGIMKVCPLGSVKSTTHTPTRLAEALAESAAPSTSDQITMVEVQSLDQLMTLVPRGGSIKGAWRKPEAGSFLPGELLSNGKNVMFLPEDDGPTEFIRHENVTRLLVESKKTVVP